MLDSALRAIEYVRTSPYTWSEKFQLIHRPYCLDLWDFQSDYDAALVGGDAMDAKLGVSKFGVFYGDNVCMAQACRNLARMLEHCGRGEDAERTCGFAEELQERVDALSWNGEFYRHHVSEQPEFERDFGIDESQVVSLSNSFAANFEIGHEKARAIIETYRRIRREMPEECLAEFMTMYPAFPKGFHIKAGAYVNGACAGLVAGELARAAFSHGYEAYGADVLERYRQLFEPYAPLIDGGMWGTPPTPPERDFKCLDLRNVANADLRCDETHDGWGGEKGNDMRSLPLGRQEFGGIPVEVLDPEVNSGHACLRIANDTEGFAGSLTISVAQKAGSIYFLHAAQGGSTIAGELEVRYADGSEHRQYVVINKHILDTWNPGEVRPKREIPRLMTAWTGETEVFDNVGLSIWGWDNPHPDKEIAELRLNASLEPTRWMIVGITLSDAEVWLPPTPTFEGPNQYWSAACVTRAMGEGLVGVVDTDRNMHAVTISPQWSAAGIDQADACLKYEDGGGYVAYQYRANGNDLSFELAASGASRRVRLPLPEGASVKKATVDGTPVEVSMENIETSNYACLDINGVASVRINLELQ
jgi:hypothetical protein